MDLPHFLGRATTKKREPLHASLFFNPFNISLTYAFLGAFWILLSDPLVHLVFKSPRTLILAGILKGWIYVFFTAILLNILIKKAVTIVRNSERQLQENLLTLEATHEELRATEEALQAQLLRVKTREARFRRIFEGVSSGVLILHPSGTLFEANEAAQTLLGLSFEQLTQSNAQDPDWQANYEDGSPLIWENIPSRHLPLSPSDRQIRNPENIRVLSPESRNVETGPTGRIQISSARFERRCLTYTIHPILNPDSGSLEEIVMTLEDITKQKELEDYETLSKERLAQSQERYREILENMSNAAAVYEVREKGQQFTIKEFNRSAEELEQINRQEVLGHSLQDVFPSAEESGIFTVLRRVWQTGDPEHYLLTYYQNGRVPRRRENYVYRLSSGEVVALYQDVTAQRQAEEALWLEKERAQVTLHSIGDGVITTGIDGHVEYLNPIAEDLTGWPLAEAYGKELKQIFHIVNELDGTGVESPVDRCLAEDRIIGLANHTSLVHRKGHPFSIEDSAAPIHDRQGHLIGAVLVFHDVSDKRALLRQMTHQAHHDALTGLPNRVLFNDRLSQAIAQAHRKDHQVAVLFLDIDRFKLINDTFGHAIGDHVLQAAAERLRSILRAGDTVGRQGGDEFIIILPEVSLGNEAGIVAEKILTIFSAPFVLNGEEVFITPSIGISLYPTDGTDIETLVKHADISMYYAKESGRNNYQFFTSALNASAQSRLEIESSLRHALERDEFIVYYQPVISLATNSIVGIEALVRWQHPRKGLINPSQFIFVAEDTGLIIPLGEWVLRSACAQARSWQESGYPLRIAVNLSARQFRQPNLVETVRTILVETSLEPQWLELEITESIAAQDVDFTINILHSLKAMGIRISIDDFGTGFSSLSYLRQFPLDTLKIDKSFVGDILPQHGEEIVTAIIDLAQNLKLKVIAEGVETPEQLAFLRKKKCDEIQGYLFCKPLPSHEFQQFLGRKELHTGL